MTPLKVGIASTDWSRTIFDSTGAPVPGGSGWVRLQQLRPYLNFETVTGLLIYHKEKGFAVADYYGKVHFDCHVLVLQRLMFGDLVNTLGEFMTRQNRPYVINDVDDWYWGLHPNNAAHKLTDPKFNPDENIEHYRKILKLSDAITVSTPFLYEKMTKWLKHKSVHLIENCVTVSGFNVRHLNMKRPTIGWVGSTSHRSNDLEQLHGFFSDRKWKFHHSGFIQGAPYFSDALGVDARRVTVSPMLPPQQYAKSAFSFDIGLAPLSDIPFNHAKSWIKAIEYAAAGVPFVASPAPEYKRLKEEYGIGRIASTQDEWVGNIEELHNTQVRNREAKEQRNLVRQLDVKVQASRWAHLLEELFSS